MNTSRSLKLSRMNNYRIVEGRDAVSSSAHPHPPPRALQPAHLSHILPTCLKCVIRGCTRLKLFRWCATLLTMQSPSSVTLEKTSRSSRRLTPRSRTKPSMGELGRTLPRSRRPLRPRNQTVSQLPGAVYPHPERQW